MTKAATFDREQAAKAWITKTEKALEKPGGLEAAQTRRGTTVGELIDLYLDTSRKEIGRTKAQVLDALKEDGIADVVAAEVTSADLVDLATRLGRTRKPQTVQNYLSHLSGVFSVARPAFKVEVDRHARLGGQAPYGPRVACRSAR